MANPISRKTDVITTTIALNASLSGAVDLGGRVLVGILMPGTWTAAGITLQASPDGVTYGNVFIGAGTEYALTVVAANYIALDPVLFRGMAFIKVRSGTSGAAVNQAAARVVTLVTAEL